MRTAVVTGATGFVGQHLVAELYKRGVAVRALVRTPEAVQALPMGIESRVTADLATAENLEALLRQADCVFHLAARAHVLSDRGGENADAYHLNNEVLTARLADAASRAGVQRFVFVSTAKVYGECDRGRSFTADDEPQPHDPYGESKLRAEQHVWRACRVSKMAGVIVRPPLVYGPGVRANFLRIIRLVHRRVPLPFAAVRNRRSMIGIGNLVDVLCRCGWDEAAAGRVLLVSDGQDLSTPDLIRHIATAMQRSYAPLFYAPVGILRLIGRLAGYGDEVARLTESLSLDISATKSVLGWTPPQTVEQGIRRTVSAYLSSGVRE